MRYDVAIVGYGPVGALSANMLGQAWLSVIVFGRDPGVHPLSRAIHSLEHALREGIARFPKVDVRLRHDDASLAAQDARVLLLSPDRCVFGIARDAAHLSALCRRLPVLARLREAA